MPPRHWQTTNIVATFLRPIAWLYGCVWRLRVWLFRRRIFTIHHLPVPVIVVGNVIAGGAGKTPVVMALVARLQTMGYQPGVISRGYGRKSKACLEVTAQSSVFEVGDEPMLIAHTCKAPVYVASSRVQAAKALLARHPTCNVIVSDDGLQHTALARDIEIVVFDERQTGNQHLLPAGPLREPWPRTPLCPVHLVLSTIPRHLADMAVNGHGESSPLAQLEHKSIHALAAVAKPQLFFQMLRDKGLKLVRIHSYPDHASLEKYVPPTGINEILLCTSKDAIKLWKNYPHVWAVPLVIELNSQFLKAFDASIKSLRKI